MGRKSRTKGATFEREVAARFKAVFGDDVKRRLGQARDSGHDIDGTWPFVVECKRRAKIGVTPWFAQATVASARVPGGIPIVVMRADNEKPLVVITLDDFLGRLQLVAPA